MIGKLISEPFIETVKNGEAKALFAQVELAHGEIRSVQLFPGINEEAWPCRGNTVVVERCGTLIYATAIWDGEEPSLKSGEKEIYSRDAKGEKASRITLLDSGEIRIESLKGGARHILSDKHFIGNGAKNLCKVLLDFATIFKSHKTKGAPGLHTVLETDVAKIDLLIEDIKKFLTEAS
jgi:hypothetical protein